MRLYIAGTPARLHLPDCDAGHPHTHPRFVFLYETPCSCFQENFSFFYFCIIRLRLCRPFPALRFVFFPIFPDPVDSFPCKLLNPLSANLVRCRDQYPAILFANTEVHVFHSSFGYCDWDFFYLNFVGLFLHFSYSPCFAYGNLRSTASGQTLSSIPYHAF